MVVRILPYAVAGGFLALGLVAAHAWVRQRDPVRGALAWSSGLLGITALAERIHELSGYRSRLLENVTIVLFLASGYALLLLRHRVMPLRHRTRAVVAAVVGGAALLGVLAGGPMDPASTRSSIQRVAELAIIVAWAACVLEPIYRLWRTARDRPAVQRARLRALSLGYGGLLTVLTVAFITSAAREDPAFVVSVNVVALLLLPVLYAAFVPPRWLRRVWRVREEEELEAAFDDLVGFHPDRTSLASAAVEWAARLVGGDHAVVTGPTGDVLATSDPSAPDAAGLAQSEGPPRPVVEMIEPGRYTIRVPLRIDGGLGALAVVGGTFTPLFGTEELAALARYARTLELALQRVTLVEQLSEVTARSTSLLDAASDLGQGVVVMQDYALVYANAAYEQITGYSVEELQRLGSLFDLAAPDELPALLERARARRAGVETEEHYETAMVRKDGRRVEVEVSVKEYEQDGTRFYVTLVRDIGDRKRAERALRTAYDRERQAADRLRSLDDMKNAFLTAVSHELRTPLTAILGFARTLQLHGEVISEAEHHELLDRIARGALKLERLLEDLLDLDRLHRNQLTAIAEAVDVGRVVREAVAEVDLLDHRVRVTAESVVARIDRPKVERIIENLLTNAAKYTPPDATISVRVSALDGGVVISVDDTGPGVPAELRAEIFQPFERGSRAGDHAPGVGIGLSLVALFAELHGGRAWVEERDGGGASFQVWLPGDGPSVPVNRGAERADVPG